MIFAGPLFNLKDEDTILENTPKGFVQNQANSFQWNCILGLVENGIQLSILNVLPVGTFPKNYNKLFLKSKEWSFNGIKGQEIGCINLPLLKQFARYYKFKKYLKNAEDHTILIYSMYYPFLKAINKIGKDYKIVLIVTDLPEFYDLTNRSSIIVSALRYIQNKLIYNSLKHVDGYVLLTEHMKYPLNIEDKPYVLIEGICDGSGFLMPNHDSNEKKIVYTGTLNSKFGLPTLLKAFEMINDPTISLHICGTGDCVELVREYANNFDSIHYYGYLTFENVRKIQSEAAVLINPRQNNDVYTKYSFPSKTLEYLTSGVPTVAYKLDGIPDDYDCYLNYVNDDSPESLAFILEKICNDTSGYYINKANEARSYVINEKNYVAQTNKIVNLFQLF